MKICWDELSNKSRSKIKDLTDESFGRLEVLEFAYVKNSRAYWKCECDCGNICIVCGTNLRVEDTNSCGCLHKETSADNINKFKKEHQGILHPTYKHGLSKTKAYICNKTQKRKAMKLNQTPTLTEMEKNIINFYYEVCGTMADYHVDHIKPISKGGLHHPDNLQILSAELNLQKHDKWPLSKEEQIKYKGYQCFYKE